MLAPPRLIHCPACSATIRLPGFGARRLTRCPKCGAVLASPPTATPAAAHEPYRDWPLFYQGLGLGFIGWALMFFFTWVAGATIAVLTH